MALPLAFTGNPLDRDDRHRNDPALLKSAFEIDQNQFLVMIGDRVVTNEIGQILWLPKAKAKWLFHREIVFLGVMHKKRHYALLLEENAALDLSEGTKPRDARSIAMKLGPTHTDLGVIAQAKSMLDWHARHRFCAVCGAATVPEKGGYQRTCTSCGAHHFPRTDPVVIMLVEANNKVMLGRGPKLPPGFYSALAGFIEPGENLEEAVARELREEAGVKATSVTYIASQPWPWPSSLMIGCFATADDESCEPDGDEIDSLVWLSKTELEEVRAGKNPNIAIPPPLAIARSLIDHWIATKTL